jgi:hypothetical protein
VLKQRGGCMERSNARSTWRWKGALQLLLQLTSLAPATGVTCIDGWMYMRFFLGGRPGPHAGKVPRVNALTKYATCYKPALQTNDRPN